MNYLIKDLLYDWEPKNDHINSKYTNATLFDTTLRDGLQSPQIGKQPTIEEKKHFLDMCHLLGIDAIEIGFPAASVSHKNDLIELAKYVVSKNYSYKLSCLSRTIVNDIDSIIEISQKAGVAVTANILIGSSKIRTIVEDWNVVEIKKWIEACIDRAHKNNIEIEFVTEDTTRSFPETIQDLYKCALDKGVKRIWIADTVGIATPKSTESITRFFMEHIILDKKIGLDWHGHNDRGLGVANSLTALSVGADRIQATALGIGERAGNTSMESIIVNLYLAGSTKYNLKALRNYTKAAAVMYGLTISGNYPVVGKYVYATAAGMHAAAIHKARKMNRKDLEGIIYGPFHPNLFDTEVEILIGPMSGSANVIWNLEILGIEPDEVSIKKLLSIAKEQNRYIPQEEIKSLLS